jgi:N-acetylmuramoyl-L-alanine amidase
MFRRVSFLSIVFVLMGALLLSQPSYRSLNLPKTPTTKYFQPLREATLIKPPLLVQNFCIFLDPGHGGHDVGAQSISKPRYQEKSLNLITAQFVKSFLQQLGYQVLMTRDGDKFVSLDKRTQIANECKPKPTLFVSIHYNSAPSAEAQGIEVFFYQSKEKKERYLKSKRLAQAVLKNVLVQTKAKSRGVKQGNFVVIRDTTMPAVLVEGGFVTNEAELQNLKEPLYLKRLAWGIVRGIEEYLSKLN